MSEFPVQNNYESLRISENTELRALATSDASQLFDQTVRNRAYLAEYLDFANDVKDVSDSVGFIAETVEKRMSGTSYGFGIFVDGNLAGHASLMNIDVEDKEPEIGYWISRDYSGRGITTGVAETLTTFGFTVLGLSSIIIRADVNNAGSNKIAEKCGYTNSGKKVQEGRNINIWRKENVR